MTASIRAPQTSKAAERRQKVAHGMSRGTWPGINVYSPGWGDRHTPANLCRPSGAKLTRGCPLIPRLGSCEKITKACHSERSEESAFVCFQGDKMQTLRFAQRDSAIFSQLLAPWATRCRPAGSVQAFNPTNLALRGDARL